MAAPASQQLSEEILRLSDYIAGAADRPLPEAVARKTRLHLLDTLGAIVSGTELAAGQLGARFAASTGGVEEALAVGARALLPAAQAAFANAMAAHGDETDDSHLAGRCHPGCAIVPAALAVAERQDADGAALLRAVALGYDVCVRVNLSFGFPPPAKARHSTHSIGPAFGAAAAAASLLRLDARQSRYVLAYAAQQASGIPFWNRDPFHVEKAFDFAGMPARNGTLAALMVASGFTGVEDPLSGPHNLFAAFAERPDRAALVDALGERFEIGRASIKKWCVGSPIQAVLDAIVAITGGAPQDPGAIDAVVITMPDDRIHIVDDRAMPDVCVQHLAAVALLDGSVSFAAAHDIPRMQDPAIRALRAKMTLVPSPELTVAIPARQAIVEIRGPGGTRHHHAVAVRGTPENPMPEEEVEAKALDLLLPLLGDRASSLVAATRELGSYRIRDLRPLLIPNDTPESHHD
ncbi:MmgE/PrpD family protein [Falsiroseomonas oryziterrae]|uniref:MmgE/PrpD family protein n=1 Tax=Falsiroseomonas oryziterrae TaxID=2911368 RepID=UPI001F1CF758|nr:MmgE/PrpD family protein [Roseomonas sp. NPKOSM-4]